MHSLYTGAGASFVTGDDFIGPSRRRAALLNALIAHWRLEEASGVRADSHAGLDLSDINTVGQAAGKLGNAASFVAGNEEILPAADQGAVGMGDIDFTLAAGGRFDVVVGAGPVGKRGAGSVGELVF